MPRPRVHDLDGVLDATERIVVEQGSAAATLRAISAETGMSNGALYHAFGSRGGLIARTWIRAARQFLTLQRERVSMAGNPVDAVIAASTTPIAFAEAHAQSTALVLSVRRRELLTDAPEDVAVELVSLDTELGALLIALAQALWDRGDHAVVDVMEACVVHLPTALLLRGRAVTDPQARRRLEAAVRAVVALEPPAAVLDSPHQPKESA